MMAKIVYARDWDTHTTRWNTLLMRDVGKMVGQVSTLVNRTGHDNKFRYSFAPIPKYTQSSLTFDECAIESARKIWSLNKPVKLAWSGGIDSTVALLALHETQGQSDVLDVVYSDESVAEFPAMHERLVKHRWKVLDDRDDIYNKDMFKGDYIKVSGDLGDQLYGNDTLLGMEESVFTQSWKDAMDQWPLEKIWSKNFGPGNEDIRKKNLLDFLYVHAERCPFRIDTVIDLYWWVNFTLKWQQCSLNHFLTFSADLDWENIRSFYNTPNFQRWAMANPDIKNEGSWKTYKMPSKRFIHSLFHDQDYLLNKTKTSSGMISWRRQHEKYAPQLVLDDGRVWLRQDEIPRSIDVELLNDGE